MPLIDPVSFGYLLNEVNGQKSKFSKHFFIRYLKIASKNIYRSSQTIDISFQFKEDLKSSFHLLNRIFGCNFTDKSEFDEPLINDYYHFLYNNIDTKYKEKILKIQKGDYRVLYNDFKMYFFKPFVDMPDIRSWFFTTSPIATLVINENDSFNDSVIKLSNLEIDLMIASGFTVVLCVKINLHRNNYDSILNEMIASHNFAEIHFNIDISEKDEIEKINHFYTSLLNNYDKIDGYFYLYSQFILNKESKAREIIKKLKQKPRFRFIFTSNKISKSLKELKSSITKPFPYCKTGFDDDQLCVNLCNVPLYKTRNDDKDFLTAEYSGIGIGYISKDDFLNYKDSRVKIIFCDPRKNNSHTEFYIDFNDIHFIKSDMYINNTIYLAKTNEKTLDIINDIRSNIDDFTKKKKKKKKKKDFKSDLFFVSRKLEKFYSQNNKDFKIHNNQLLTVLEACQSIFFAKDSKNKNKGVIYQVETGEGKSIIVQIVAAVLALAKKTVHIVSSNYTLSNRDYYDSYDFFKEIGLTSAVLLHYNELPYIDINNSKNNNMFYDQKKFPKEFFGDNLFSNPLNMNFSVCGINSENYLTQKANIIFSTISNFECFYLKMSEMCPDYISKYYDECSLIIDEADSILIDELLNGTILSRPIKTNANDILQYVYESWLDKVPTENVFKYIKEKWPECKDMKLYDVVLMYQDIEIACQDEFCDGKKYSIREFEKKEHKSLLQSFKKSLDDFNQLKEKCKNQSIQFIKNIVRKKESKESKGKHHKHHKHHENISKKEKKSDGAKNKNMIKMIFPFDYKNKGILEPSKEFGGFVQQFIAIKEKYQKKEENSNLKIKDVTMNYLFVSHPVFVNLYNGVIGLTGTIGNKYDQETLKDQYNFTTMKIPRNKPNKRIELPILLCDNIDERNKKIVSEVIHFHLKDNPVLVIFQSLSEIALILMMLSSKGIKNINIFDGMDEKIKPDNISGMKGAITLGTNVCGRGTDIKNSVKPLHVIVTYFTSNSRVIYQAFGRTARQGNEGSARIICLKEEYVSSIEMLNREGVDSIVNSFELKNKMQIEFTEKYKQKRPWIFFGNIKPQELSDDVISTLRQTRINANRFKACNFRFPICMKVKTFLDIQAQKIFSLYNCPNCRYTWMLFQKYVREMILQSWSIQIDNIEKKYDKKKRQITYEKYLQNKINKLYDLLDFYLPDSKNKQSYNIIDTFMNIHKKVYLNYTDKIMDIFPEILLKNFYQYGLTRFCSFTIGFKPYMLTNDSGEKVSTIDGTDKDINYIKDPELTYMRKLPKNKFIFISITEAIDKIFDEMCKKINDMIGAYVGLKFFMRRTLGGCEFGICIDYDIKIPEESYHILIDRDPLFVFTISLKSVTPLLAGILIFGLVYLTVFAKSVFDLIANFPSTITTKIIKKALAEFITIAGSTIAQKACEKVCSFLIEELNKNLNNMRLFNQKMANVFDFLLKILIPKDFSKLGDEIQNLFAEKVKLKMKSNFAKNFIKNNLPWSDFIKIGVLLLLCFSSYMMVFHHKKALNAESNIAQEFNKNQILEKSIKVASKYVDV